VIARTPGKLDWRGVPKMRAASLPPPLLNRSAIGWPNMCWCQEYKSAHRTRLRVPTTTSHLGQEHRFGRSNPTSLSPPESVQTCDLSKWSKRAVTRYRCSPGCFTNDEASFGSREFRSRHHPCAVPRAGRTCSRHAASSRRARTWQPPCRPPARRRSTAR
jgi:hypothetical protein